MTDDEIEAELNRLGDLLIWGTGDTAARRRIWEQVRHLHRQRSAARVRQMERDQGLLVERAK